MKFDLQKALSNQIVLLTGDEEVLRRRALTELVEAASGGEDFDTEQFFGDSSSPTQWIGSCGTAPFLSPRRVAVVRNLLRFDGDLPLPSQLELPGTALLILVADSETGDDSKQRTLASRAKKWETALKKAKAFVFQAHVEDSAFIELLKHEAAKYGKTLGPNAALAFNELLSGNLSASLEELEKVAIYVGTATQITERDVRAIVLPAREWNVFKLIDAVFSGRNAEALQQLRILLGGHSKAEGPIYGSLLPMLGRQLKLVWQARAMIDSKASLTSVPESIRTRLPSKTSLLSQKEYPQRIAMQMAQKVTMAQLTRCLELLAQAEARMKGLMPMFTLGDAIEQMVLEMSETVGTQRA